MPDAATTNNKRTRSQTTLDQFRFNPAASPLKQARSAFKNAPTTAAERSQPSQPTPLPPPASGADDNVQDETMDDHHLKRPSSPGKDAALLHQPDLKRPRHAIFPPPKPSTLAHPPSTSPSSPDRRAKSVPPSPSPVPLLDLNNVPPSPRRSPTKFRIASVPPEDRRDPSPDPDSTDDPAMILLPTSNSLAFVFEHATPAPATFNRTARLAPLVTPMSPLTPLPPTLDDSVRTDSALDLDATPVPRSPKLPALLTAQTPAPESTPRASTSHTQLSATTLPPQQPKLAHPPLQSFIPRQSGVKSRMRPKGKAAAVVASTSIAPQDIAPPAKKLKNPRDTEKNHLLGTAPSTIRRSHSQKPVSRPGRAKSEAPERKPAVYGKPPRQAHPKPSGSQTLQSHPTPRARTPHAQPLPSQAPRAKTPSRPFSRAPSQPPRIMSRATSNPPPLPQPPLVKTPPVATAQLPPGPEHMLQDLPRKLTPEPPLESSQQVAEQQESQLPPSSSHPASETDHRQSPSLSLTPPPESEVELEPELDAVGIVQEPQPSVLEQPTIEASPVEPLQPPEEPLSPLTTDSENDQDPQTEPPQTSDLPQSGDLSPKPDPTRPIPSTLQLTSSLSHLTEVLNKLNAAPPSRPNTSMGFHRSISGTSDGDEFSSDMSVGTARLDAGRTRVAVPPGAFTGAGKQMERSRPEPSMSTSTVPTTSKRPTKVGKGSAAIPPTPIPAGGQKQLKQTTLMLPPPIPSTRTTRLRSQAVAAAAAAATASAAGGSTPARTPAKTPAKETGKEKMGTQTRLFPALAAATAASGSGSAPRVGSGRTARSSYNRPVFAFARLGANAVGPTAIATPAGTGRGGTLGSNGVGSRGPFAFGAGRGTGRVTQRVSKASSLPMVIGSPVKGSGTREDAMDVHGSTGDGSGGDVFAEEPEGMNEEQEGEPTTKDKIDSWLRNASKDVLRDLGHGSDEDEEGEGKSVGDVSLTNSDAGPSNSHPSGGLSAEEKERLAKEREARRNASRRASMASHLLSQSLSALPDLSTTAASLGVGKDVKGKARAVSSTYPNGSATSGDAGGDKEKGVRDEGQKEEEKPLAPRAHNTRLATGALSTPPNTYKERGLRGEGSAESKGKAKDNGEGELGGSGSPAVGALAVLRDCRIFVDVRTDEGDDAGGLFVDMLRGMGAKIANRVGSRCTHVVFKNGLMSTISRYKSMDPKPHVVGIAWVVECVEQRIKVDESRFTVNLQHMNVAGVNKRRKSMLPKHYSPVANKIAVSPALSDSSRGGQTLPSMGIGANGPSRFAAGGRSAAEASRSATNSSLMDVDDDGHDSMVSQSTPAMNGGSGSTAAEDDELARLPPLERARRRKSMLMGLKP